MELEARVLTIDQPAGDIRGQEIGCELDPAHRSVDRGGDRLGQHGLAGAGNVFQKEVAFGEQTDERHRHLVLLAPDDQLDVGQQLMEPVGVALDRLGIEERLRRGRVQIAGWVLGLGSHPSGIDGLSGPL